MIVHACAALSGGLSRPAAALPGTPMTASMSAGRGSGSGVALHATPHIIAYGMTYVPATIYRKIREYAHRRPAGV